jgi:UDP-2,4-diacetamido-2,4,6-trideoxy-beta-L-altropyranose hydrolase
MSGTLLLRADADTRMGTGHVMRCLALAERWQDTGGTAHLLTRASAEGLLQFVASRGVLVSRLPAALSLADDGAATARLAGSLGADWLVIDGYHFDHVYQAAFTRAGLRTLVIDDMADLPSYEATALLNQNIGAESYDYQRAPQTLQLLGPRYVNLRRQFDPWRAHPRTAPDIARRVLVTLGGADPDNLTATVISALDRVEIPGLEARVIVGAANPHMDSLRAIAEKASRVQISLLSSVTDMPAHMAWADMAIAAGGTTCFELLFMGLPSLLLVLAANQIPSVRDLHALGAAQDLGAMPAASADAIAAAVGDLASRQPARRAMSELGRAIVDGYGGVRVLSCLALLSTATQEWRLRPAALDDAFLVWQWANEPGARANSFHTEPIPWERHLAWYRGRLASADCRIWLLERYGAPAGVIRYDRSSPHAAEISYSVARSQRGLGIGTRLLVMSQELALSELGVRQIDGTVFESNIASARSFLKAGYAQAEAKTLAGHTCLVFRRVVPSA